jgi:chromosomal replication initiator protein
MKSNFKLSYILSTVCSYYGVSIENVKSNSRKANFTQARQLFCYLARNHSEYSFPKIADEINRDHATVIHSVNKLSIEKEIYSQVKKEIEEIEVLLYSTIIPYDVNLLQVSVNYTNFGISL